MFFKNMTDYVYFAALHKRRPLAEGKIKGQIKIKSTPPAAWTRPGGEGPGREERPPCPFVTVRVLRGVKGRCARVLTRSCSPPEKRRGLCGLRLPGAPLTLLKIGEDARVISA